MQPWKMFIRSVSVVTVLTAGGFAAGQAVMPFTNTSRTAGPAVDEETPDAEVPVVDPAAEEGTDSETTTTTEAPKDDAPSDDPVDDPAPTKPPVVETPDESSTTTTTVTSAPIDILGAPAAPVADPAPAVAPKPKKAKKTKTSDHNCDGHFDNGWLKHKPANKTYPSGKKCPPAAAPAPGSAPAPAAAPAPAPEEKGRSATAPGQVSKGADRPDGAPGHAEGEHCNRPATAPGQLKKSV